MQFHLPKMHLIIPNTKTLEFKEALIFGLLGVLKLRNEINVLSSVTGARNNHSTGEVFL
jgi:anhydro-N-acetylmuramic acid kinase